jgi:hypothetical protein
MPRKLVPGEAKLNINAEIAIMEIDNRHGKGELTGEQRDEEKKD